MSASPLIEVLGHFVVSFTRSVTEHYNPEEPEFTAESVGYNPIEATGREWYYHPVGELIYQEYSDKEATRRDYLTSRSIEIRLTDACSLENEETDEDEPQVDEEGAMAWKGLRPSLLLSVCKSMYFGASISLLSASVVGTLYMLISYLSYKTMQNCEFQSGNLIPIRVQWMRTIVSIVFCLFIYMWFSANALFLFRPFQLMGVKRKLILVSCLTYCLDTLYRVALQALGISNSKISTLQKISLNIIFLISICWQVYLLTSHFGMRARSTKQKLAFFFHMTIPNCFCFLLAVIMITFIYPSYNKQNREGKLIIAVFAPLIGIVLKVISRICAQRLWNTTHPGRSYVLLVPLHCGTAIMFRVLQADLDSLQSIAILGIIHGAAEVMERSTMVVIDHICHMLWKRRRSAPWGSFRTPRRERLMADITIMSMLFESSAIVSVNGFLYSYRFIYLQNDSLLKLLSSFAVHTLVPLVIEWFFTSVSLVIATRYQNMAAMAVWRRQWKRHMVVTIVNVVPVAIWTSTNLLLILHGRFHEANQPCKMPFS